MNKPAKDLITFVDQALLDQPRTKVTISVAGLLNEYACHHARITLPEPGIMELWICNADESVKRSFRFSTDPGKVAIKIEPI